MADQTCLDERKHRVGDINVDGLASVAQQQSLADQIRTDGLKHLARQESMAAPAIPEARSLLAEEDSLGAPYRGNQTEHDHPICTVERASLPELRRPANHEETAQTRRTGPMRFFDVRWVAGVAPRTLVPLLQKHVTRRWQTARVNWNALPPKVRGATIALTATGLLLLAAAFYTRVISDVVEARSEPFLVEALEAPYPLDERSLPVMAGGFQPVLPAAFGDFRAADKSPLDETLSVANRCLIGLSTDGDKAHCPRSNDALVTEYGRYFDSSDRPLDVVSALFDSDNAAAQTVQEVFRFVRSKGPIGNFSLEGVSSVDFFYGSSRGTSEEWVALTWAHGPWVFSISAQSDSTLDAAVKAFPY